MKRIKSPTGCVHAVDYGAGTLGWATICRHNDYSKSYGEGFYHNWPLTEEKVTCKRCLSIISTPCYTEEVMYQWPASQICEECGYAYKVLNYSTDEDFVLCNKKCKLNNGRTCPEKKHEE